MGYGQPKRSPHPMCGFAGLHPETGHSVTCVWESDGNGGLRHPQFWQNGRLVDLPASCRKGIKCLTGNPYTPEEALAFWRDLPRES